jgi:hypothetical protein
MTITGTSQTVPLEKYKAPVQAKPGTVTTGNGLTDILIKNSKGEDLIFSGKNLLSRKIDSITMLGEKYTFVKELDTEGEKGAELFNGVMISGIAAVPASWASIMAVNAIKAPISPGVKFAIVAGATVAAGVGMSKLYFSDTKPKEVKGIDNSAMDGVKIDYVPVSKSQKNLETGLGIGLGAFVGGAFGFFTAIPLASTEAFGFGATVGTVVTVAAVAGGTLGYLATKSK